MSVVEKESEGSSSVFHNGRTLFRPESHLYSILISYFSSLLEQANKRTNKTNENQEQKQKTDNLTGHKTKAGTRYNDDKQVNKDQDHSQ